MYEVIVGNMGTVYGGDSWTQAVRTYNRYVSKSRESREPVTFMVDGKLHLKFFSDDDVRQWPLLSP
jgi:hypothetical protein